MWSGHQREHMYVYSYLGHMVKVGFYVVNDCMLLYNAQSENTAQLSMDITEVS